jgi:hypothetical protein
VPLLQQQQQQLARLQQLRSVPGPFKQQVQQQYKGRLLLQVLRAQRLKQQRQRQQCRQQ